MKLKINRWEFDVTNEDWVLDNGAIYQCLTLKHWAYNSGLRIYQQVTTVMSKKQFNQLVKENKLTKFHNGRLSLYYPDCTFWKFNLGEEQ